MPVKNEQTVLYELVKLSITSRNIKVNTTSSLHRLVKNNNDAGINTSILHQMYY